MKTRHTIVPALLVIISVLIFGIQAVGAESESAYNDNGQYILRMMEGRGVVNNRVPAIVLDQVRGIVWTCQNLQDGRPLWVKADLGQNGDKPMNDKKYVLGMLQWQDADLRMPAIVLDIEKGITWTCQNIIDGNAMWVQTDLKSGEEKEVSRVEIGRIKAEK
jgi:hypothetical protein